MDDPRIVKVDREKMQALEELAATTMKVSEGHNALEELRGMESGYIAEREGRAGAAVDRVLRESEELLASASANNEAVTGVARDAGALVGKVTDLLGALKEVMARFDQKTALWEKNMQDREDKLDAEKKGLMLTKAAIDGDRKNLDKLALDLNDQEARVDSKRQDVEKMITSKPV